MRFLCFLILATQWAVASASDEIVVALQNRLEADKPFGDLVDSVAEMPVAEMKQFSAEFEAGWKRLRANYLLAFQRHADSLYSGSNRNEKKRRVRELREEFHRVRELPEGAMKSELVDVSMPAMEELRRLLMPDAAVIMAKAPADLRQQHKLVHGLARFRDELMEVSVSYGENGSVEGLQAAEAEVAREHTDVDRSGLRIMEKNDSIAESGGVSPLEREGIREVNEWRLLLDQNALVIDPKLCDAGRGHSQDMEEHDFFAHMSPIPGKKTPSDRAREAGTRGGGENIYMGAPRPEAANKGWFFSPGHHKNMFRPNYRKIGLGQHNRHWTQMFS
ncbi:MAG: CAP domain-containing protein [Verrucomicrobiota bacterium JB023]|nr:CAP domain-containing protein [Verrucomicrobiota bacterium JB023]